MAPPNRSRRKRHSKSPRNKRFGSGKSTPSSPAGTPSRLSLAQRRAADFAGETSKQLSNLESELEVLACESPLNSSCASSKIPEGSASNGCCTFGIDSQGLPSVKEVDVLDPQKIKTEGTANMSAENKLDRLSGLLDNMVIEYKAAIPSNVKTTQSPVKTKDIVKTDSVKGKDIAKADVVKSKNNVITVSEVSNEEKSRDEVELERKARKEAKKAKKKGGNKENEKDGVEATNINKSEANKIVQKPIVHATQQSNVTPAKVPPKKTEGEGEASGKSKADLKRERREKQEAQRKAKEEAKAQQEAEKKKQNKDTTDGQQPKKSSEAEGKKKREKKSAEKDQERRIPLLGHLTPHSSQPPSIPVNSDIIHPAIRTLGIKMKERVIDGSTARVVSMLSAFKRVIADYQTPESCDLHRDLAEKLITNMTFLKACRPLNIAMDNAISFLKHEVNSIGPGAPEAQAKDNLRTAIDEYIKENIVLASSTIASHAAQVIKDGDVILTFGYSALVSDVVEAATSRGERVCVVVADTPHPPSGAAMAKRLADLGVTTYYRLLTEVSHIMNKVTKVIVEAESVMMNGAVQGLCGTAALALAAANHDTPFIVLCHTYKFCNNDLSDSLVLNELGDANSVVSCPSEYSNLLCDWRDTPNLNVVSLVYDVTPAELVTALITEQNVLPTSAVPVIIRRNYADILGQD